MIEQERTREDWLRAATCWEFLAVTLRLPNAELAEAVASGEWGQAGLEVAAALGIEVDAELRADLLDPLGASVSASGTPSLEDPLLALRAEYTRLFVYTPEVTVAPYESVWFAQDKGIEPMLYVSRAAMEVERFCKQCGLGRPQGTNEPLDHVATECELLELLAMLAAGVQQDGGCDPAGFPGGSAAGAYEAFRGDHGPWMPRFAAELALKTRLRFFRAAARLLDAAATA